MKRTKYLLSTVLAVSLLGFSSCDDYLDKLPDNRMELKSTDDVSNLLVSAYSSHYPAYLLEMYSDNTDCIDNTGWTEYDKFQGQAYRWEDITEIQDAESPQELWNAYYKAISSANASIEYIAKLSDTEKQSILLSWERLFSAVPTESLCFLPYSAMHMTKLPLPVNWVCLILSIRRL